MDEAFDESVDDYARLSPALRAYCDPIAAKVFRGAGATSLTEAERLFFDLYYYLEAALVNNGDVFGYTRFITEHRADFATVGAHGTLKAIEELMPFYREQQQLKDATEKGAYWWRTRDERAGAESLNHRA